MGTISINACFNPTIEGYSSPAVWQSLNNVVQDDNFYKGITSVRSTTSAGFQWQRSAVSQMTFQQPFTIEARAFSENMAIGLNDEGVITFPTSPGNYGRMKHCMYLTSGASSNVVAAELGVTKASSNYSVVYIIPWMRITADATELKYYYSANGGSTWILLFTSLTYDPLDTFRMDVCLRMGANHGAVLYKLSV